MFNDRLSDEGAREIIEQRRKEVEICRLQKQLGFGDTGPARRIFLLTVLVAAVIIGVLL